MNFLNTFAIDVYTQDGLFVGNWPSLTDCYKSLGLKYIANARACLNGRIRYSEGYIFKSKPIPVPLLENEEWKHVVGYEGLYAVSNKGRVAALTSYGKENFSILQPVIQVNGYLKVTLSKNKIKKSKLIHRLVAEAFVPNPDNKEQVDHIDTNILNNCADNLRWVTSLENHYNPLTLERHKKVAKHMASVYGNEAAVRVRRIPIKQTVDNVTLFYSSYLDAARQTGYADTTIREWCINGKHGWSKVNNN